MDCPRCGARDVTTPECPACGVMVAKARAARPRPERTPPASHGGAAWRTLLLPALGLVLLVGAAVVHLRQTSGEDAAPGSNRKRPPADASRLPDAAALP